MSEGNRPLSTRNSEIKKVAKIDEEQQNIYNHIDEDGSGINDPYYKEGPATCQEVDGEAPFKLAAPSRKQGMQGD